MAVENKYADRDFEILEAVLITERDVVSEIELLNVIYEIEIYEHLEKPYITGYMTFVDSHAIIEEIDIQGIEKFQLTFKSTRSDYIIKKDFRITGIQKQIKGNEKLELTILNIIEEHAYVSECLNINRAYNGSPTDIISQIITSELDKNLNSSIDIAQGNIRVIVPNMTPLDAAMWIKNKATSPDGLPFYLYSVLAENTLRFHDLGSLLVRPPINAGLPYRYAQASTGTPGEEKYRIIEAYSFKNQENMLKVVNDGYVGSENIYYDITKGRELTINYNAKKDLFDMLRERGYLSSNQTRYNFPPEAEIRAGEKIGEHVNRRKSSVVASETYRFGKTVGQQTSLGDYKTKIIGDSVKPYLDKSHIKLRVPGRDFITGSGSRDGEHHLTIGNVIKVNFQSARQDIETTVEDLKKSGNYLIYGAHHTFKLNKLETVLLCVKLSQLVNREVA